MVKRFGVWRLCGLLMAAFLAFNAPLHSYAEEKGPKIALDITARKEFRKVVNGREVVELASAKEAGTGDVILYTITARNEGGSAAVDATIVDPIPSGTVIVPESVFGKGAEVSFSINNGVGFSAPPIKYRIKTEDGREVEKEATPEMYTHVRWVVRGTLAPGKSRELGFKARIR